MAEGREPEARIEAGMRALLAGWQQRLAAGDTRLGFKIALNDPKVQARVGLADSLAGCLSGSSRVTAEAPCELPEGADPAVEPEIALTVGPDGTVAGLAAALEIVDRARPAPDLEAVIRTNFFHAGAVLGSEAPGAELADLEVVVLRGDAVRRRARIAEAMPAPEAVLRLVERRLAPFGLALRAGDRILSGSLTPPLRLRPGERVRAEFGPLGALAVEAEAAASGVRVRPLV